MRNVRYRKPPLTSRALFGRPAIHPTIKFLFVDSQGFLKSVDSPLRSENQFGQPCSELWEENHDSEPDHLEKHKRNDASVNVAC